MSCSCFFATLCATLHVSAGKSSETLVTCDFLSLFVPSCSPTQQMHPFKAGCVNYTRFCVWSPVYSSHSKCKTTVQTTFARHLIGPKISRHHIRPWSPGHIHTDQSSAMRRARLLQQMPRTPESCGLIVSVWKYMKIQKQVEHGT